MPLKRKAFQTSRYWKHGGRGVSYNISSKPSKLRRTLNIFFSVSVVSGLGLTYLVWGDEGRQRSLVFWYHVFPTFMHYRWVQLNVKDRTEIEQDREYNRLHDMYAEKMKDLTMRLRGYYLKNAQQASVRDDFIPEQYMVWCKEMQDESPCILSDGQAREIIESSLGRPIDELFAYFNDEACGSASIGQVHKAILHDGREVAVKVQFPGIEKLFRNDLQTLRSFCELAMPQFVPGLDEIDRQFLTEFDYIGEANNLLAVREGVLSNPYWEKRVAIPEPVMEMCSNNVLTMTFLPGVKLIKGTKQFFRKYADKQGVSMEHLEAEFKEKIRREGREDLDKNVRKNKYYQMILSAQDIAVNYPKILYNYTLGWLLPNMNVEWSEKVLNLGEILTLAVKVHGYEIFVNGKFNGDPHPGNILLLPDGRLGLIDYGQFKDLTDDPLFRDELAKLCIALCRDDRPEVVRSIRDLGFETKNSRDDLQYRLIAFWLDRDTDDILQGHNWQSFVDYIEHEDPIVDGKTFPSQMVMPARVSMLLRGLGLAFGLKFSVCKLWRPYAEEWLRERNIDY